MKPKLYKLNLKIIKKFERDYSKKTLLKSKITYYLNLLPNKPKLTISLRKPKNVRCHTSAHGVHCRIEYEITNV